MTIKTPGPKVQAPSVNALANALQPNAMNDLLAPQRREPRIRAPRAAVIKPPRAPGIVPARPGRGFTY